MTMSETVTDGAAVKTGIRAIKWMLGFIAVRVLHVAGRVFGAFGPRKSLWRLDSGWRFDSRLAAHLTKHIMFAHVALRRVAVIDAPRCILADPCVFSVTALAIVCSTLWSYLQLDVWAHDDIPNLRTWADYATGEISTMDTYLLKEGRWLHELLRPLLEHVDGTTAVFANLISFFFFACVVARRYTSDTSYSVAFAALCVQSLPVAHQLAWPVITLPSFLLLFSSAATVRLFGIVPFYIVFGILFSGGLLYLYFMLPLLHLPLLSQTGLRSNLNSLLTRITPPWIGGFFAGWLISIAIVYLVTLIETGKGQLGLDIAEWRKVDGGWWDAALNSYETLYLHMNTILASNVWSIFATLCALILGVLVDRRYLPTKILCAGIILACYVAAIPIGIVVDLRSVVPLATGVAAFLFLAGFPKYGWKNISIKISMLLLSVGWALQTIDEKLHMSAVTGAWMDGLVRVASMDPSLYKGVVLLNATPPAISAATRAVEEKLGLPHRDAIYDYKTWASTALASGFRHVSLCSSGMHYARRALCGIAELLCQPYSREGLGDLEPHGLYDLRCVLEENLVVAINGRFSTGSEQRVTEAIEDVLGHSRLVERSYFDIYLRGKKLYYLKDPCTQSDIREAFFLHIFPKDSGDLSERRQQSGFDNLDHRLGADAFMSGACASVVDLPDYPISRVVTGQYTPGRPATWRVEFML